MFGDAGPFQVDTASCVEEALEMLKRETYDAVVSDYQMPGKDGLQFLKELRQKGKKIPFVIFTGKGREEVAMQALNLGVDGYFNKTGQPETVYGELAHGIRLVVEAKRAEEEMASLARFPSENPNPVLRIAKDDIILYANAPAKSLLDELKTEIGQSAPDFLQQSIVLTLDSGLKEEIEFKHGDRTFLFVLSPVTDSAYVNVYGLDVTERKKTEEEAAYERDLLRTLLNNVPDYIYFKDKNRKFVHASRYFSSLFNRKMEDVIGKRDEDLFPKEISEVTSQEDQHIMETGTPLVNKLEGGKIGGEEHWVLSTKLPWRDEKGNIRGLFGFSKDVTTLKKAEDALKESAKSLEVLNEKLGVVGKLTRHDVRNKLFAVVGNTYLAKKTLPNDHKALDYLQEIESACTQTTRILDFATTYESLGVEEFTFMDVDKAFDEAVSLFSDLQDVKVVNECHGLTVLADSLLRQLFYNLIDNSLKYGEKLSRIRVYYEKKNDHLNVVYEDDGGGVPQNVKPKLFGEGHTTGKGSGYGLFLVKRMMEVYGWTIQETGMPDKGAQFTITIPKTNPNRKENYRLDRKR